MYLCIYVSMYLYSYSSTHGLYLDWLQAVLERNRTCAWRWQASELRDALGGRDRPSSEIHLEAVMV